MDGSFNNRMVGGELFRLVSLSQALERFVPLIFALITRKITIFTDSSAEGLNTVIIKSWDGRNWILRVEDYEKCLKIVEKFSTPITFPSSIETTLGQIESYIKVEFFGRT